MTAKTLIEHRHALSKNPEAYSFELQDENIDRLVKTLVPHLKTSGYTVSPVKSRAALVQVIRALWEVQDQRPMFHVEGTELPLCWNAPKNWDLKYVKYEWGHLQSKNQNPRTAHRLENLALYSARCNQHIQTSMNIEELMTYGGVLAHRISSVLTRRRFLFASEEWSGLHAELPSEGA